MVSFNWANREAFTEFMLDVDERAAWFEHELLLNMETLLGLKGLYDSSEKVERSEFNQFADLIIKRHSAIKALEWVPYVPHTERGRFESFVRNEGYPDFQITERIDQGKMARASNRDGYFPVCFMEPFKGNELAFGFDLASNPKRLKALNYSRNTGDLTATESITLVQEKGNEKGFLAFLPVYKCKPGTIADRGKNLAGFVLGVYRINDIFNVMLQRTQGKSFGIDMKVVDITESNREKLLYYHASRTGQSALDSFVYEKTIANIGGRKWQISSAPTKGYIEAHKSVRPFAFLFGGLIFTVLLSVYINNLSGRAEKVRRLVDSKTAELKNSETKIRAIVETIANGIITIDSEGIVATVNPAAENMFGYKAEEVVGKNIKMLMPDPFHSGHDGYLSNYLNTGKNKIIGIGRELVGRRRDKTVFPIYLAVSEMNMANEKMFVGVIIDITERKKAEEERLTAQKRAELLAREAEAANKSKSEFLARMSHEIRTPMNAILGMAELLSETELTAEQKKYIDIFSGAGDALLLLINDILDLSKIESGQIEIEKTCFDLNKLLNETVSIMGIKAKEKGIKINCNVLNDVPVNLEGDPTRLRQIIINLIGNSLKFTDKGRVSIKVENNSIDNKRGFLLFSVSDTGSGIPKDKQQTIFDSFAQADSSVTRKHGGTGLGLAISQKLVELMGGKIYVESEPGKGSVFYFTCKFDVVAVSEKKPMVVKETQGGETVSKPAAPDQLAERKVLLVEDNKDNTMLALAFMKKTPFKVETAENGAIAVDKFKNNKYDIVLMDIQMPVMDGHTATGKIREWEKSQGLKPTPIVALTAHALKTEDQKSLEAGCNSHITKPIKKETLIKTIYAFTANKESSSINI